MNHLKHLLFVLLLASVPLWGKIYDTFTFFNELELLAIRLEELDPVVDYFVLVEGTQTFTGAPKPLYFKENRHLFEPYLHKIIHVIVDDYPVVDKNLPITKQPWIREAHQRNAILRGLTGASSRDVVLLCDVDEIPRREAIMEAKEWVSHYPHRIASFELQLYRYQLNRKNMKEEPWKLAIATSPILLRRRLPDPVRLSHNWCHFIKNGGWHFTSQGGLEKVLEKLRNISHAHDKDCLEEQKRLQQDYDKMIEEFTVVPIDQSWPSRVKRLRDYYDKMGWIAH
jgi:beta-1,4-mannosyl-glycoprotein beta-1,4-N-acetylglucosaminyltransferase